jgi:hypothetical protein
LADADPIVSDVPGSFPWHVWHERHPVLLRRIRDAHPFPPDRLAALDMLLDETRSQPMRRLAGDAPDRDAWDGWGAAYYGRSWLAAPFLWAESYFYRRLLDATGYLGAGPFAGVDPFAPMKTAELSADITAPTGLADLLRASLWGNQADLGFLAGRAVAGSPGPLVADDSDAVLSLLRNGLPSVALLADNAGRELVYDLLLVDHLLHNGCAGTVTVYLKPRPYYVSDATTADVVACLNRLDSLAAHRLREAAASGRLSLSAHPFQCAPFPFHHLPSDLADELSAASLVIAKGDLNYRRLVGDCHWPPDTPFADTVAYFPAPVVALRILKSDVVVGLDGAAVTAFDAGTPGWRTDGRHALVQASDPAPRRP